MVGSDDMIEGKEGLVHQRKEAQEAEPERAGKRCR